MNSLLLLVLVAIAVLAQALASEHHKSSSSSSSSSSSTHSLRSKQHAENENAKAAMLTVETMKKSLSPYMTKGVVGTKTEKEVKSQKKMAVKTASDMQSGWVEMRMRTKADCKGKVPMVMGVRLGCSGTMITPPGMMPMTGSVNVHAHSDSTSIYATMNMHNDMTCSPTSWMNSFDITSPKCSAGEMNMGTYLNWNATKDFHNYNGIVKLGYGTQTDCMMSSNNPISYQMYRENECMPTTSARDRLSSKFVGCSIGPNGPQVTFQSFKGLKCKSAPGKNSGLVYEDTMLWSTVFETTPNSLSNMCTAASGEDLPLANYFKYGCVHNGVLMIDNMSM